MAKLPNGMNEHYGRNVDTMPQILGSGEVPVSVAGIMKARLEQGRDFPALCNQYWDSSDLVIYPKGDKDNIYVLLTTNNQRTITENGRNGLELIRSGNLASNYGAIVADLDSLGSEETGLIKVARSDIKTETYFTPAQIQDQRLWRILARNPNEVPEAFAEDGKLLTTYSTEVQKGAGGKNMALYLGNSLNDETTLKAWCVNGLGGRSGAGGGSGLVNVSCRFLGIAPEALVAPGSKDSQLEKSVQDALTAGRAFEYNGMIYVPTQDKNIKLKK